MKAVIFIEKFNETRTKDLNITNKIWLSRKIV